jgi:hypothetical protein
MVHLDKMQMGGLVGSEQATNMLSIKPWRTESVMHEHVTNLKAEYCERENDSALARVTSSLGDKKRQLQDVDRGKELRYGDNHVLVAAGPEL